MNNPAITSPIKGKVLQKDERLAITASAAMLEWISEMVQRGLLHHKVSGNSLFEGDVLESTRALGDVFWVETIKDNLVFAVPSELSLWWSNIVWESVFILPKAVVFLTIQEEEKIYLSFPTSFKVDIAQKINSTIFAITDLNGKSYVAMDNIAPVKTKYSLT